MNYYGKQVWLSPNRTTTDAIFIVREAIKSTKNPLYLCMIELRAAYDHIDRDMLFSVLISEIKLLKLHIYLKHFTQARKLLL